MAPVDHDTPANVAHELGTVAVMACCVLCLRQCMGKLTSSHVNRQGLCSFMIRCCPVIQLNVPWLPSMALDSSPLEPVLEMAEKAPL